MLLLHDCVEAPMPPSTYKKRPANKVPILRYVGTSLAVAIGVGAVTTFQFIDSVQKQRSKEQKQQEQLLAQQRQADLQYAKEQERIKRLRLSLSSKPIVIPSIPTAPDKKASSAQQSQDKDRLEVEFYVTKCAEALRLGLKDPDSLKILSAYAGPGGTMPDGQPYTKSVIITYTATNSYGGRVKEFQICNFSGSSLIFEHSLGSSR